VKKLLAAVLLVAATAAAQSTHPPGVPASVTSITPRNPAPGVPPSVASFSAFHPPASTGFTAFHPPPSTSFTAFHPPGLPSREVSLGAGFGGWHGRPHRRGFVTPAYYPTYYPVYAAPEPQPEPTPQPDIPSGNGFERELWTRAAERSDRALDRRDAYLAQEDPRYGEHYLDSREQRRKARPSESPEAATPPEPAAPETQLVLVLRDGAQLELGNYAIVGATIYDLSGVARRKKIPLADLDLAATEKANDARGFDFRLPSGR